MKTTGKIHGKVAVITGASKGIGAAIAKAYGAEGASVVINYVADEKGAKLVAEEVVNRGGKAIVVQGNVSSKADMQRLFSEAKTAFGSVDILVNNAGIYSFAGIADITEESFHAMYNTNVLGTILATQQAVQYFDEKGGTIINFGSVVTTLDMPTALVYTTTKYAVDGITHILAKELAGRKIRVNSINPGLINTEGTHASGVMGGPGEEWHLAETPLGRVGEPSDIAKVAVFLASDDSYWINGEVITVSGGQR
jgi:3-oxoacyl-[acyl-carrier protein] reductase